MMYDELVKWLRSHYCGVHAKAFKDAADAIEDLQKCVDGLEADNDNLCERIKDLPKWIPVTERLPELKRRVLVADRFHIVGVSKLEPLWDSNVFVCDDFSLLESNSGIITHWMPLPEPPKDGEE